MKHEDKLLPKNEELQVIKIAQKYGFSHAEIKQLLYKARFSSYSRFIESFLREFVHDIKYYYKKDLIVISIGKIKLYIPKRTSLPLGRYIFTDFPSIEIGKRLFKIVEPEKLINILEKVDNNPKSKWENVRKAFILSNSQLFLSYILQYKNNKKNSQNNSNYLHNTNYKNPNESLVFFEQWCANGHLLHPTPKTKEEISITDLTKYIPESRKPINLKLIALHKTLSIFNSKYNYDGFLQEKLKNYQTVKDYAAMMKVNLNDYFIIPVHPWQFKHKVLRNIVPELSDKSKIIDLRANLKAYSLISFRSLYCPDLRMFLKVPTSIKITSGIRALSPRPCHNGLLLSEVFSFLESKKELGNKFHFQKEVMSIRLTEENKFGSDLSVIYRESLNDYVDSETILMPLAALFEDSPINSNNKIIDDLLNEIELDYVVFLKNFLKITLPVYLKLLIKFGIGVEAHLQNTIICIKDRNIIKVILRDPDAISICYPRLNKYVKDIKFYKDSWTVSNNIVDGYDKLVHSYVHSSIAEIINHISVRFNLNPSILWKTVSSQIDTELDMLSNANVPINIINAAREYLFKDNTRIKSLLKMKLEDRTKDYIFVELKNTLVKVADVKK